MVYLDIIENGIRLCIPGNFTIFFNKLKKWIHPFFDRVAYVKSFISNLSVFFYTVAHFQDFVDVGFVCEEFTVQISTSGIVH